MTVKQCGAAIRFRIRRARFTIALAGIGLSSLFLFITSTYGLDVTAQRGSLLSGTESYLKFLALNPPAIVVQLLLNRLDAIDESAAYAALFGSSVVWWLFLSFVFRRKHARVLQAV